MSNKRYIKVLSFLVTAIMLMTFLPSVSFAETERRVVRVAFPEQAGMSFVGHTGKLTGYNYDYLEKISEFTGWKMDYYVYETGRAMSSAAISGITHDVCIAVSKKNAMPLLGILNSYIGSLSAYTKTYYLDEGNAHSESVSLARMISMYPLQSLLVVGVFAALLAAAVLMVVYSSLIKRKNRELVKANNAKSEFLSRMSHDIRISSTEGVGTTFVVTIPFNISEKPADTRSDKPASIDGLRLMIVEDNELNAEIAQVLLTDEGADVTVVTDGKQAVDLFSASEAGTFDAILMDIMMPVMDGLTACRTIRAMERPDAGVIPIIAMTANAFAEDVQNCLAAGMNAHLAKPLDVKKMRATILEQVRKR